MLAQWRTRHLVHQITPLQHRILDALVHNHLYTYLHLAVHIWKVGNFVSMCPIRIYQPLTQLTVMTAANYGPWGCVPILMREFRRQIQSFEDTTTAWKACVMLCEHQKGTVRYEISSKTCIQSIRDTRRVSHVSSRLTTKASITRVLRSASMQHLLCIWQAWKPGYTSLCIVNLSGACPGLQHVHSNDVSRPFHSPHQ